MKKEKYLKHADSKLLYLSDKEDVVIRSGRGMYLYDTDGNKYLDFIGGWAVTGLGHSPKVISSALYKQSRVLINSSPAYYNVPLIEYAKLITDNSAFDRVFFCTSGSEANEGAIKLARKYGKIHKNGAYKIITLENSFHGRTLAAMSASGKPSFKKLFNPKVSGFVHVPINDTDAIAKAIDDKTCAVLVEPIQGEGGVNRAKKKYVNTLRQICDDTNTTLIFDEIQTGFGRTGKLFAYEHFDVEPDIITLGKGIGGGFPLAAILTKDKYNVFEKGEQGGTYTNQPLSAAVGYAVLKEILDKDLCTNSKKMGSYIKKHLKDLSKNYPIFSIRGRGLMMGFDLGTEIAAKLVAECFKAGLLINSPQPKTIRLIPPLIVQKKHIDRMIKIFQKCLDNVLKEEKKHDFDNAVSDLDADNSNSAKELVKKTV